MQPLTPQNLAANAYRILGLSGSATQAEIDAAARRMRIWSNLDRIPATPWDVPLLGRVPRTRSDIEQAVALLHQPVSRIEQRLGWYCGSSPNLTSFDDGLADLPPDEAHDSAVAALHAASMSPADPAVWREVVRRFRRLQNSLVSGMARIGGVRG